MQIHGSCAARGGAGVLLVGPPGSGKSDLVLRLRTHGFELVADDRVDVSDGIARPPPALAGLLEVRGLGIFRLPHLAETRLALVVDLAALSPPAPPLGRSLARLPVPERHAALDLPLVRIEAAAASAPERVALALDGALGRVSQVAGAFAA
jgi:HPr kinase/phosphorylase